MIPERLAIAFALIILAYLVYRLYGWFVMHRLAGAGVDLGGYKLGRPAILYFTDPGCAPCRLVQDPALEEVSARYGERLQVIKIQALDQSHLTDSWGVLSLPTTFIIDSHGQPRGVNHGVARAPRLFDQLAEIGEASTMRVEPGTIDSSS